MSKQTRRDFWKNTALTATAMGAAGWPSRVAGAEEGEEFSTSASAPDLVLLNGRVYTVDDHLPSAEAFSVKHGRFIAVGSTARIRELIGPGTDVIDAQGMTVTPGFIDAYASFEEKLKGSITPGKLADFAVLTEDPHKVDPDQIKQIKVVRTVVGGRTVHA